MQEKTLEEEFREQNSTKKEWKPICSCSETVPFKDCMLHSCPCGCEMSIADNLYQYYHSDLQDRFTLEELELEEFYNLMQDYRHTPLVPQEDVVKTYEAVKSFISSREEKAREEGRKEGRMEMLLNSGIDKSMLDIHNEGIRTQYKEELKGKLPEEKITGDGTFCKTCGLHRAAGECDCVGFNKCLSEVKKLLN